MLIFRKKHAHKKKMFFQKMDELWIASKSRLVNKVKDASNEEERLKLQPALKSSIKNHDF